MPLYEFPICLAGIGDTPEEAWHDAVECFTLDPGHPDPLLTLLYYEEDDGG